MNNFLSIAHMVVHFIEFCCIIFLLWIFADLKNIQWGIIKTLMYEKDSLRLALGIKKSTAPKEKKENPPKEDKDD